LYRINSGVSFMRELSTISNFISYLICINELNYSRKGEKKLESNPFLINYVGGACFAFFNFVDWREINTVRFLLRDRKGSVLRNH
jgi:hypothetical protein